MRNVAPGTRQKGHGTARMAHDTGDAAGHGPADPSLSLRPRPCAPGPGRTRPRGGPGHAPYANER